MTSERTERSLEPLTDSHLDRLAILADYDHQSFTQTRRRGHPEYRDRRVAVALAQGAALHYIDGRTGVKDLDLWTFYAQIPGESFNFGQRKLHRDFGPSSLGRNLYPSDFDHKQLKRWLMFDGRRVDLMIRALPIDPTASSHDVVESIRHWLREGAKMRQKRRGQKMPSPWHLSHKAMILLEPLATRGTVVWEPDDRPERTGRPIASPGRGAAQVT